MSDFVYPSYFDDFHKAGAAIDQLNQVIKPFQILAGGYQIIFKNGKGEPGVRLRRQKEAICT